MLANRFILTVLSGGLGVVYEALSVNKEAPALLLDNPVWVLLTIRWERPLPNDAELGSI